MEFTFLKGKYGVHWTIATFLLGVGITIFFFQYSNTKREPIYAVKNAPSLIFDKDAASSKIKLISNDSVIINESVYITSLVVWNNGGLEIKKTDIRKDFKIKISEGARILDYKIIDETHPGESKFELIPENGALKIDWAYFDPGYGFELRVIYAGLKDTEINVSGSVLGAKVKEVTQKKSDYYFIIIGLILISTIITITLNIQRTKNWHKLFIANKTKDMNIHELRIKLLKNGRIIKYLLVIFATTVALVAAIAFQFSQSYKLPL